MATPLAELAVGAAQRDVAAGVAVAKRRRPGRRDAASLADDSLADDSLALSPTTDSSQK